MVVASKQSAPSAPTWGRHALQAFAERLIRRLPDWVCDELKIYVLAHGTIAWGSGCSGTDSPYFAWCALAAALKAALNIDLRVIHVCSAERSKPERDWLNRYVFSRHNTSAVLFGDCFDLSRPRAADMTKPLSGTMPERIAHAAGGFQTVEVFAVLIALQWWFYGFSCKAVSSLCIHKEIAKSAASDIATSTGSTLQALYLFLDVLRGSGVELAVILLENVPGIFLDAQHELVLAELRCRGYAGVARLGSAIVFGPPQDRKRVWFALVPQRLLDDCRCSFAEVEKHIDMLYELLSAGHGPMQLSSFLMDDEHPLSERIYREKMEDIIQRGDLDCDVETLAANNVRSAAKCASKGVDPTLPMKWVVEHRALFAHSKARSAWVGSAEQELCFPEWLLLPDRIRDLMDEAGIQFPHPVEQLAEFSQTKVAVGCGALIPKARRWVAHLARELAGLEALWIQGIWIEPEADGDGDDIDEVAFWNEWPDRLSFDMAGNAFSAFVVVVWCLVMLCVLAFLHAADLRRQRATRKRALRDLDWSSALD